MTGARTLLLRSAPRPAIEITDRRPQHHPVDEEFLCLDGRFTLEGSEWLTPLTYVYYPAGLVHGFRVDIPDGYEVYLRNSGPLVTERVDTPAQDRPYFTASEGENRGVPVVAYCADLIRDAVLSPQTSIVTLRNDKRNNNAAFIVCVPLGGCLESRLEESGASAEVFILEGGLRLSDRKLIGKRGYASLVAPAHLRMTAAESTILLLNVCGGELIGDLTRQAGSVSHSINSYIAP